MKVPMSGAFAGAGTFFTTEASFGITSYTYDMVGNLLNVTLPDGRAIEYLTDGRHRRIAKKVNGVVVRRWVYQDQLNPTAELDGNGMVLYRYAYGSMPHSPDFVVNATGETYRVIRDH
jgi:YD repeat-containing protein